MVENEKADYRIVTKYRDPPLFWKFGERVIEVYRQHGLTEDEANQKAVELNTIYEETGFFVEVQSNANYCVVVKRIERGCLLFWYGVEVEEDVYGSDLTIEKAESIAAEARLSFQDKGLGNCFIVKIEEQDGNNKPF